MVEQTPLQLVLALIFRDEEGEKNVNNLVVFPGTRPWVLMQGVYFPLRDADEIPFLDEFDSTGRLILRGENMVRFLQQDLPVLSREQKIILPTGYTPPKIVHAKPEVIYSVSEQDDQDKLALILHFSYEGRSLCAHTDESQSFEPFEEEGSSILIHRDIPFEKETLESFKKQGFHRVSLDRFETGGESALDFVAETLPKLQQEGKVFGAESLQRFRVWGRLGKNEIRARVSDSGMDWLSLRLGFRLGEDEIPFEVVRRLVAQGQRYLKMPRGGYLQITSEEIKAFEEELSELGEGIKWEGGVPGQGWAGFSGETSAEPPAEFKLRKFHLPYLTGLVSLESENPGLIHAMDSLRKMDGIPAYVLPSSLKASLRPYQQQGYDWLRFLQECHFHPILADDMGLGKTVQALAFLQDCKTRLGSKPNLILAPTSVVFNWVSETEKFTPELKTLVFTGSERKKLHSQIAESDLVLTNYATFRRDADFLAKLSWRSIVLDEAQYIKNYRSKTSALVKELQADQRLALTGTPLENRLSELWSIFDFLMPGFLGGFQHFRRRYQRPIEETQDAQALERLKKRIHPFVMRRQKEDVAPELPPKTEIDHYCEMLPEQRRVYQEILEASRKIVFNEIEKKGLEKSQFSILTALLRLRQVCCHPGLLNVKAPPRGDSGKMESFKELVTDILSEGHRVIIFSQFVEMLTLLRGWIESQGIAYEYLDGRTRRREEKIRRFQDNADIPLFLISLKAGGTGLNLSQADYVIHYDPWWNPAVQDQATDRVHRIGQTQHVFSYRLVTEDSVEEKILLLQERKRNLLEGVLTRDSAFGKKLSYEDLQFLFS